MNGLSSEQILMDMFASCKESGHVRQTTYDDLAQVPPGPPCIHPCAFRLS